MVEYLSLLEGAFCSNVAREFLIFTKPEEVLTLCNSSKANGLKRKCLNILNLESATNIIEEHHRCFGLGGYFMAAVLAAAIYSRIGFSLYFGVLAQRVRVPSGSKFHLEPGTLHRCWNLIGT